jgi:fatty aldehyde decarbonylase
MTEVQQTQASRARIQRIIASQAITGESVGIDHYARMIPLARSQADRLSFLEDAWRERQHLLAVQDIAAKAGWSIEDGRDDPYWSRVRAAFEECAARGDLLGCRVVQDVVLECFAVSLYRLLAPHVDPPLSARFELIADDEATHLAQGLEHLGRAVREEPERAEASVEFANERVARVLAEWLGPSSCAPVCGICGKVGGGCLKPDLDAIEVDRSRMRGDFANRYGQALRTAAFPPARMARWLARLLTA